MRLQVTIAGERQVDMALTRFPESLKDPSGMQEIADYLLTHVQRQFAREGDGATGKWAPLSPRTIADKIRNGYPTRILVRTGEMRDAIVSRDGFTVDATQMRYAPKVPHYARYHQHGTERMPRRRIVDLSAGHRKHMAKILHQSIIRQGLS